MRVCSGLITRGMDTTSEYIQGRRCSKKIDVDEGWCNWYTKKHFKIWSSLNKRKCDGVSCLCIVMFLQGFESVAHVGHTNVISILCQDDLDIMMFVKNSWSRDNDHNQKLRQGFEKVWVAPRGVMAYRLGLTQVRSEGDQYHMCQGLEC